VQHAGVVDQQRQPRVVAQHQRQLARQFLPRARACHVQRQHVQAARMLAGEGVQVGRPAGVAAGGDHAVAAGEQLAHELQAETAVGAGDEAVGVHAPSVPQAR